MSAGGMATPARRISWAVLRQAAMSLAAAAAKALSTMAGVGFGVVAASGGAGLGCVTNWLWPAACGPGVPSVVARGTGPLMPEVVGAPSPEGRAASASALECGGAVTAVAPDEVLACS